MFSAGDFAAMAAVNDPNVVLASAEVRFIKPARVGDRLTFEARVTESKGRRRSVEVRAADGGGTDVFSGTFGCFVPERHVLADR
jgi:acyl-coenzyme A thioesterase PaaI-like protein